MNASKLKLLNLSTAYSLTPAIGGVKFSVVEWGREFFGKFWPAFGLLDR